ncbi:MAG: hypothetical protein R6X18_10795 [Chloroflexota bacterium]
MKPVKRPFLIMILMFLIMMILFVQVGVPLTAAIRTQVDMNRYLQNDNAGWSELGANSASGGGISNTQGVSREPSLAIGPDNFPIVAWADSSSGNSEIYVRRWNGFSWVEMGETSATYGGISNNHGDSRFPAVAVSPDGMILVAWSDNTSGHSEIYVRRWKPPKWVEMGPGSATGNGISENQGWSELPRVAFDLEGLPVIAWTNNTSDDGENYEIYVRRWDESTETWDEIGSNSASGGGISNNNGNSRNPIPIVASDGTIIIVWYDNSGVQNGDDIDNNDIYVRRWLNSAWVEMGNGSASGGGISNSEGNSLYPVPALLNGDMPIVAWADRTYGNHEIYVRSWDGTNWVEIGAGSASGGGISQSSKNSMNPSLAVTAKEVPIIAWYDNVTSTNSEIYIRRWDGADWSEMGSGSATGGGISQNNEQSSVPSLAVAGQGPAFVAWKDKSSGNLEIYVRQSPPIAPCFTLSMTHVGMGADPVADPINSGSCTAGKYVAGEQVILTAQPEDDWRVGGWTGTNDDNTTALTNMLTMPKSDHTVGVTYVEAITYSSHLPCVIYAQSCFAGPDEVEDNGAKETANGPLCQPGIFFGWPNDQRDYYYFDTTGGPYEIELTQYEGYLDASLFIDSEYTNVDYDGAPWVDGLKLPQTGPKVLEPGRYFIWINDGSPDPDATQKYSLRVQYVPAWRE